MGDLQDTYRALHTSIRGLPKNHKRSPGRPRCTSIRTIERNWPSADQPWLEFSMATGRRQWTVLAGSSWRRLRSSLGHVRDDDDDGIYAMDLS